MARLFSLLSAVAVLMILTAGAGVYWISTSQITQAKHDSAEAVAKSVALGLTAQVNLLTAMLEKMAQDPEVVAAVTSDDSAQLTSVAAKLERYLPGILKVRLLLPGVRELDDLSAPKMGYADLYMVRETFTKNQLAAVQGDNGPDRHLAITRRIMQNDQAVGVILASLNYDFISKTVQAAELKDGYIELKQAALGLGVTGKPVSTEPSDNMSIKVANTGWDLHYRYAGSTDAAALTLIAVIIVVSALLALLVFFIGYRKLSGLLTQDLGSVLKACKDMMTSKLQGTYPMKLTEMNAVVSTLMQFKRVMDHQGDDVSDNSKATTFEMSSFFDESEDNQSSGSETLWPEEVEQNKGLSLKAEVRAGTEAVAGVNKPAIEEIQFAKPEIVEKIVPDFFEMPPVGKKNA